MGADSTAVVVLRLAGPMQSWGTSSVATVRDTNAEPSKSGVIGLVAAAMGITREEPLGDLPNLGFGVRVEQQGARMTDYQVSAAPLDGYVKSQENMPLAWKHYLTDAVFLAFLEGPREVVETIADAVRNPRYEFYLGRKNCPATGEVVVGVRSGELEGVIAAESWAGEGTSPHARLRVMRDAKPDEAHLTWTRRRDVPVRFNAGNTEHRSRAVLEYYVPTPGVNVGGDEAAVDYFEGVL